LYDAKRLNADVDLCPSSLIDYQAKEIRIVCYAFYWKNEFLSLSKNK